MTLEVFFMFNFYKKLDKEVVRIRTMPQKPSRKLGGFFYKEKSTEVMTVVTQNLLMHSYSTIRK